MIVSTPPHPVSPASALPSVCYRASYQVPVGPKTITAVAQRRAAIHPRAQHASAAAAQCPPLLPSALSPTPSPSLPPSDSRTRSSTLYPLRTPPSPSTPP